MADNPILLAGPQDDYDSIWTGEQIDEGVGRARPGGAIDTVLTPKWLSTGIYPPGTSVIHAGVLWTNVSDTDSANVEPGTDLQVWYPKILDMVPSAELADGSVTWPKLAVDARPIRDNLLDNACWAVLAAVVNQRGVSGTITTPGYFIDRWKLISGSVTIAADGLILNGTIAQIVDRPILSQVTASVLTETGIVPGVFAAGSNTFSITASGVRLIAAKLEEGPNQTLAHQDASGNWVPNEIPDYGEQLAKCQRYLYPIPLNTPILVVFKNNSIIDCILAGPLMAAKPTLLNPSSLNPGVTKGEYSGTNSPQCYQHRLRLTGSVITTPENVFFAAGLGCFMSCEL